MKISSLILATTGLALTFFATPAMSEDQLIYGAGFNIGLRAISFDIEGTSLPGPGDSGGKAEIDLNESLLTAGLVGGLSYGQFTLSGSVEISPSDDETRVSASSDSTANGVRIAPPENRKSKIDRFDLNLTASYRVWEGLSLFSGYKYTRFDIEALEQTFILGEKDQVYELMGLFIGTDYTWSFGSRGALSASVAYAFLDAELSENNVTIDPNEFQQFGEYKLSGSATGVSLGLQWNVPVTENWSYNAAVKYQSFETKNNNVLIPVYIQGNFVTNVQQTDVEVDQTDTVFTVGVLYTF